MTINAQDTCDAILDTVLEYGTDLEETLHEVVDGELVYDSEIREYLHASDNVDAWEDCYSALAQLSEGCSNIEQIAARMCYFALAQDVRELIPAELQARREALYATAYSPNSSLGQYQVDAVAEYLGADCVLPVATAHSVITDFRMLAQPTDDQIAEFDWTCDEVYNHDRVHGIDCDWYVFATQEDRDMAMRLDELCDEYPA